MSPGARSDTGRFTKAGACLAVLGALAAGGYLAGRCSLAGTDTRWTEPLPKVSAARVERGPVISMSSSASLAHVASRHELTLRAGQLGRIAKIGKEPGDSVQAGELLLMFSADDIKVRLRTARALLATLVAGQPTASGQSQPDLSRQELIIKARNEIAQLDLALQASQVRAPFAGTLTRLFSTAGAVVTPGEPLLALVDLADLCITAEFAEAELLELHPGQDAEISSDNKPERVCTGQLRRVPEWVTLLGSGSRALVVDIAVPPARCPWLRWGQTVSVRIVKERREGVLRLPYAAVGESGGSNVAYRIAHGRVELRKITLGAIGSRFAEIRGGLHEGDIVWLDPPTQEDLQSKAVTFELAVQEGDG